MNKIQSIEEEILFDLKTKYKFKVENACFASGLIPKLILLDKTRNIHSYLIICKKTKNNLLSNQFYYSSDLTKNLIELTKIQYSELGRPLFLLYKDDMSKSLKLIDVSEIKELFFLKKFNIKNLFKLEIDFDEIAPLIKNEL